jgi:hypothetical protein
VKAKLIPKMDDKLAQSFPSPFSIALIWHSRAFGSGARNRSNMIPHGLSFNRKNSREGKETKNENLSQDARRGQIGTSHIRPDLNGIARKSGHFTNWNDSAGPKVQVAQTEGVEAQIRRSTRMRINDYLNFQNRNR